MKTAALRLRKFLEALLELDWLTKPWVFVLIFIYSLSRAWQLNAGFGLYGDAWRIANTAFDINTLHIYNPSRFPGYPLPEFMDSLVIRWGWVATNALAAILTLASVIAFAQILKDLAAKNKGLLVLAYAFISVIWVNSGGTIDYTWALSFVIFTWFFALRDKWAIAGLMMGLAVGSRLTAGVFILPLLYLAYQRKAGIKNTIWLCGVAGATALVLFLPLFIQYGFGFITYYSDAIPLETILYRAIDAFGIAPVLFGVIVVLFSLKNLIRDLRKRDGLTIFLLATVLLYVALYIKVPYKAEYMLPAVPFGLLLVNNVSRRMLFVPLVLLLVLESFVSLGIHTAQPWFSVDQGRIATDIEHRTEIMAGARTLLEQKDSHAAYVVGGYWLLAQYFSHDEEVVVEDVGLIGGHGSLKYTDTDTYFYYLISLDELQNLLQRGYMVYYLEEFETYNEEVYGFRLSDYGTMPYPQDIPIITYG
jgi:hypothetical protein